jgi:hypothetical protein
MEQWKQTSQKKFAKKLLCLNWERERSSKYKSTSKKYIIFLIVYKKLIFLLDSKMSE